MTRHESEALWGLASGELSPEERTRVESHVRSCESCARELEHVKRSREWLLGARDSTPQVRWDAVGARLQAAATAKLARMERRPLWPGALALAGMCAAVLAFFLVRPMLVTPGVEASSVLARGSSAPGVTSRGAVTAPPAPSEGAVATRTEGISGAAEGGVATRTESASGAVIRDASGTEQVLRPGMHVRSGVAVRTPARATALLRLPDASRVRVSSGSEVELSRAEEREVHLKVRQGRLAVQASHAERRGFVVEAAGMKVSVVGTVFTVERTEQGASVAVTEGRVRVEAAGQPPRFVGAGERLDLSSGGGSLEAHPLSTPDRTAIQELESAAPAPEGVQAVPTHASVSPATGGVMPAVARVPQTSSAVKPAVTTAATRPATVTQTSAVVAQTPKPPSPETTPAPRAPAPEKVASTPARESEDDFAPYPARSVTEALPPLSPPPPPPPTAVAQTAPTQDPVHAREKKRPPLIPSELVSSNSDERYLGFARMRMGPRTCGNYLRGLEEIATTSKRADFREQARYLRARCFDEQLRPDAARGEYQRYLQDFPKGRYVQEARTALLP